jgi:hypothetical protein
LGFSLAHLFLPGGELGIDLVEGLAATRATNVV